MPSNLASIKFEGDWKAFEKFLSYSWGSELNREIYKATGRNARYLLAEIRKRIREKEYQINALSTAIKKGFTNQSSATPLVDTGRMIRDALVAQQLKIMTWEVGIVGNMKMSHDGNKTMQEIVPVLHNGATISVNRGGKKVIIRIPPRPFLSSVWNDPIVIKKIQMEWYTTIEKVLKKYGKL